MCLKTQPVQKAFSAWFTSGKWLRVGFQLCHPLVGSPPISPRTSSSSIIPSLSCVFKLFFFTVYSLAQKYIQVCPILKRYPLHPHPHKKTFLNFLPPFQLFLPYRYLSSAIHKSGTETTYLYLLRAFLPKQNKIKLTPLHTDLVASEFCSHFPDFYCRSVICRDVNNCRRRKSGGLSSSFRWRGLLPVSYSQ